MEGRNEPSKFWFLRRNKFFRTTKMAGWSFIYNARTLVEATFWYLVIFALGVITIRNVVKIGIEYLSYPTNTVVLAVASTKNISISNFTLKLNTSLLEYSRRALVNQYDPIAWAERLHVTPWVKPFLNLTVSGEYACRAISPPPSFLSLLLWEVATAEGSAASERLWKTLSKQKQTPTKLKPLSSTGFTSEAIDKLKLSHEEIENFLAEHLDTAMPENGTELDIDFGRMLSGPLASRSEQLELQLMMLEAREKGFDPWEKLKNIIESMDKMNLFTLSDPAFNKTQLDDIPTGQILTNVLEGLDQVFSLSIKEAPNAKVYLRDWHYSAFSYGLGDEIENQKFTLEVIVPPGTNKIVVEIRSFLFTWFRYILRTFLAMQANVLKLKSCSPAPVSDDEFAKQMAHPVILVKEYYRKLTGLLLETHRGNGLAMMPFKKYTINIMPNARFVSKTRNCYESSYETCSDQCANDLHLEACHCYPWNLYYLNEASDQEPCNKRCDEAVENNGKCEDTCEELLNHPCELSLYMIEHTSQEILDVSENDPLFAFEIHTPPAFSHPQFLEEYEMTMSSVMAQIGGLINFWMGVNLIGIIHLLIYFIKQCVYYAKGDTKTARTVKRLWGKRPGSVRHKSSYAIEGGKGTSFGTFGRQRSGSVDSVISYKAPQMPQIVETQSPKKLATEHNLEQKLMNEINKLRKEVQESLLQQTIEIRKIAAK